MVAWALSGTGTFRLPWIMDGQRESSSARSGIAGEHFRKNGEKMQGNARGPLRFTREAVRAYASQAGFQGMGNITIEHSVRVIVPSKDVVQPRWPSVGWWPVGWQPLGNSGHCHAGSFPDNRANLAATQRGGAP